MRLISRTMRATLTPRVLGASALAAVLPTLLLTPLQAEVILLHSDCEGGTHAHRFDVANLQDWRVHHDRENPCCGPGETDGTDVAGVAPLSDCDHNQPPVIIARGPFLAVRAGQAPTIDPPKALHPAGPAVVSCAPLVGYGSLNTSFVAAGSPRAPRDGTAMILSRNHALLL